MVGLLCGACSNDGAVPGDLSPATRTAHPSKWASAARPRESSNTEDEHVIAAVRKFWATYLDLAGRPGPFDEQSTRALLASVSTGASLERLVSVVRTNAAAGYRVRGSIDSSPQLVEANEDGAVVRDCQDDRSGLYEVSSGSRIDADDPLPHLFEIGLKRETTGWKVATVVPQEQLCTRP
jgi:hypothetical protein